MWGICLRQVPDPKSAQMEIPHVQETIDLARVIQIVEGQSASHDGLIATLGSIQAEYGYLPEEALRVVATKTNRKLVDIYGVATFYRSFSLTPRGRHRVCACVGTACHVRGAGRVVEELERKLGIEAGQSTEDNEFSLDTVNCLGACALGPVVVINDRCHAKVKKSGVGALLDKVIEEDDEDGAGYRFPLRAQCPLCGEELRDDTHLLDGHPSIRLDAVAENRRGWVRLSSLCGSQKLVTEFDIPKGCVSEFCCSHCGGALPLSSECWDCAAPMASFLVMGGGSMRFCSRHGCATRLLDVS